MLNFIKRLRTSNCGSVWKTWDPDGCSGSGTVDGKNSRVILFVIPKAPTSGPQAPILPFAFPGKIKQVRGSAITAGVGDTVFKVEQCPRSAYVGAQAWSDVVDSVRIPSAQLVGEAAVNDVPVAAGDYFRVNISNVGQGLLDLTVEVVVEVD